MLKRRLFNFNEAIEVLEKRVVNGIVGLDGDVITKLC